MSILISSWGLDVDKNLDKLFFFFYFKQKRKLRLYISNTFNPAKPDAEDSEGSIASWELRVEGKLLDDVSQLHFNQ